MIPREKVLGAAGAVLLLLALLVPALHLRIPQGAVLQLDAPCEAAAVQALPASGLTGTVNVNTADLETLCTVPGIGPVTAQAIIEARETGGAFVYDEDLLSVKGIGEKTLEKLRPYLTLQGPAEGE